MTEKRKKLLIKYGPRFIVRYRISMADLMHLIADTARILEHNEKCMDCAIRFEEFAGELYNLQEVITRQFIEAAGDEELAMKMIVEQYEKMEE